MKRSTRLNTQKLREEHDKALNAAKENGAVKNIERLDKLSQNLEDNIESLQFILLAILDLYHHMNQVRIHEYLQ